MATWQYTLYLLPYQKLIEHFGEIPNVIGWETFERTNWWENIPIPSYEKYFDNFLTKFPSWAIENLCWGNENGNLVEGHYQDGVFSEFYIRIDIRKINDLFIEKIIDFARQNKCVLLSMEWLEVFEPEKELLINKIKLSKAYLFVTDKDEFFRQLQIEKIRN